MGTTYRIQISRLRSLPRISFEQGNARTILNIAKTMALGERHVKVELSPTGGRRFVHQFRNPQDLAFRLGTLEMQNLGVVRAIFNELSQLFCEAAIEPGSICDLQQAYNTVVYQVGGDIRSLVLASIKVRSGKASPDSPTHPIQTGLRVSSTVDPGQAAVSYEAKARTAQKDGALPEAHDLWSKALEQRRQENNDWRLAFCIEETAKIATDLDRHDEALALWQEALVIRTRISRSGAIAFVLEEIAKSWEALGNQEMALQYWYQALEKYEAGDRIGCVRFADKNIARLELLLREPSTS